MSDYVLDRVREKVTERESQPAEQHEFLPRHPFGRPRRSADPCPRASGCWELNPPQVPGSLPN